MRRFVSGFSVPLLLGLMAGCGGSARPSAEAPSAADTSQPEAATAPAGDRFGTQTASASARAGAAFKRQSSRAPAAPATKAKADSEPAVLGSPVVASARSKEHLVYTADITLAVYLVDQGLDQAEQVARSLGGYLASRDDQSIVLRVPRERFEEALSRMEKLGDVVHRDVRAVDVTDEFVDTESRLKNARVLRDRLQALLGKAAVKEAIEIERELGRVTEQIEVLEGKLKLLSDRIAFSTLTVRYAAKGSTHARPSFRLPFVWVQSLGVHRLLEFQQTSAQ